MKMRKMVCADKFYPSGSQCKAELEAMFAGVEKKTLAGKVVAGIVPHAGWVFSGQVAAEVFEAIARSYSDVETFVIFGASHSYMVENPVIYESGSWETPIGSVNVDAALAEILTRNVGGLQPDKFLHSLEHSIEVNVPFIKFRFPQASIVPILVPPIPCIIGTARRLAQVIAAQKDRKIVCLASSDLTHYGTDYGFTPAGQGTKGCTWAKDINDTSLINSILAMDCEQALEKAMTDSSACGPAAITAAITAAKELGATKATLLSHKHSSEIMKEKFNRPCDSTVGYAAIIFTK